jgi:ABC-type nitrate/sulfonate/bicarbonate transport system ATPase subunit
MTLVVAGLAVQYRSETRDLLAVSDIDLEIPAGEFVSVIGPSGCGKSTLLHCLGGLLRPTAGSVSLSGETVTEPRPDRAAFVFQDYSLFPWRSVVDNAAIGLRFANVPKAERRTRAMRHLELLGIGDVADAYPAELSGGMQQRVAVARALTMDPDVLLMDEPFGALDEQSRRRIGVDMSAALTETGRTVVMVTHSLDEAIFWADRIVVLSTGPGRIVEEIRIAQPRPRRLGFLTTPEFDEVRGRLLSLLTDADESEVDPVG